MTNKELKDILYDMIQDEDILDQMIILEGDEFADGVIGITNPYMEKDGLAPVIMFELER